MDFRGRNAKPVAKARAAPKGTLALRKIGASPTNQFVYSAVYAG